MMGGYEGFGDLNCCDGSHVLRRENGERERKKKKRKVIMIFAVKVMFVVLISSVVFFSSSMTTILANFFILTAQPPPPHHQDQQQQHQQGKRITPTRVKDLYSLPRQSQTAATMLALFAILAAISATIMITTIIIIALGLASRKGKCLQHIHKQQKGVTDPNQHHCQTSRGKRHSPWLR
jgi:flagellar basal body-associated protein FliL